MFFSPFLDVGITDKFNFMNDYVTLCEAHAISTVEYICHAYNSHSINQEYGQHLSAK